MIRKLLLPTLALLVLASCSSRMSLVKRKYNKGFYVNVSKKNNNEQIVKESGPGKAAPVKQKSTEISAEAVASAVQVKETAAALQLPSAVLTSKTTHEKNHISLTASADKKEMTKVVHHFIKPLKAANLMKVSYAAKADSNKIIQIILALFPILCLIAVYLHDNGVTLNFWITLILHLTFIGAMIFALLVVLDVVNLA